MSSVGEEWGPDFPRVSWSPPAWFDRALAWLRRHEQGVLILAAGFQVLFLVGMIIERAAPLRSGRTVLLHTVPVDPRDLIRGDYVTLSYDISRVKTGMPPTMQNPSEWIGQTVYVTLVPEADGRHYRGGAILTDRPAGNVTFIKGTLIDPSRIRFGIESYFVQEGKGHDYEDAVRKGRLWAEVALSDDGDARLRRLVTE
jgi:uncharacterized membrane-anchored protein